MPETRVAEVAKAVAADVFDQPMHMQNGIFTQRISLFRKTMVYSGAYASTKFHTRFVFTISNKGMQDKYE